MLKYSRGLLSERFNNKIKVILEILFAQNYLMCDMGKLWESKFCMLFELKFELLTHLHDLYNYLEPSPLIPAEPYLPPILIYFFCILT